MKISTPLTIIFLFTGILLFSQDKSDNREDKLFKNMAETICPCFDQDEGSGAYEDDLLNFCFAVGFGDHEKQLIKVFGKDYESQMDYIIRKLMGTMAVYCPEVIRRIGKGNEGASESDETNLALLNSALASGDYPSAVKYGELALEEMEVLFGKESGNYINTLLKVSIACKKASMYDKSVSLLKECEMLLEKAKIPKTETQLFVYMTLADAYEEAGEYGVSGEYYKKSLSYYHQYLSGNEQLYLILLNNLGKYYIVQEQFAEGVKYLEDALQLYNSPEFNGDARMYVAILSQLSGGYVGSGAYEKAEKATDEILKIVDQVYETGHPDYATIIQNAAATLVDVGKYQKAEPLYFEALKIIEEKLGKSNVAYAKLTNNIGSLYSRTGQYKKALEFYEVALQKRKDILGDDHLMVASTLSSIAGVHQELGLYRETEDLYNQAREIIIKKIGKESPSYINVQINLGELFSETINFEKAKKYLEEATQISRDFFGSDSRNHASASYALGDLYINLGSYDKAEELITRALEIIEPIVGKGHPTYSNYLGNLAALYKTMGLYEKSEELQLETIALRSTSEGVEHPNYASALGDLAILYEVLGKYEESDSLFTLSRQIKIRSLGENYPGLAKDFNNHAYLYKAIGEYDKAEKLFLEGLELVEENLGKEHPDYLLLIHNLGELMIYIGQYERAEQYLTESMEKNERIHGKHHFSYLYSLGTLAGVYYFLRDRTKALELMLELNQLIREADLESHPDQGIIYSNLGLFFAGIGEKQRAEVNYIKSLEVTENHFGKYHPRYSRTAYLLAYLLEQTEQYEKADSLYKSTLKNFEQHLGSRHPDYINCLAALGKLNWIRGKTEAAYPLLAESAFLELERVQKLYPVLSERERLNYWKNKTKSGLDLFKSFAVSHKDQNTDIASQLTNLELTTKGLGLSIGQNVRNQILQNEDVVALDYYDQWINLRRQISESLSLSPEQLEERNIDLDSLELKANALEKKLNRHSSEYSNLLGFTEIKWQELQKKLKPKEAAVLFINYESFNGKNLTDTIAYSAIIIRPEVNNPQIILLEGLDYFKQQDIRKTAAIDNNSYVQKDRKAEELYNLIWAPLQEYLNGVEALHFAPSGILNQVAFSVLKDSGTKKRLSEVYVLHQYTSLRDMLGLNQSDELKKNIALIGAPDFEQEPQPVNEAVKNGKVTSTRLEVNLRGSDNEIVSWSPLDGTLEEIKLIEQMFGKALWEINAYTGRKGSEEQFKEVVRKKPRFLHIATHGFFLSKKKSQHQEGWENIGILSDGGTFQGRIEIATQPLMRSGLILTGANKTWRGETPKEGKEDGILTAYEIANLNLRGIQLVVLSACETGLGEIDDNEGVFGLQRAFKLAGVDKLMMSLWKIDDTSTVEFMELFYSNYLEEQDIHAAFISTQREMIKNNVPPYYWAGFVLVE